MLQPLKLINQRGIPALTTVNAVVESGQLIFTLNPHPFVGNRTFNGVIAIRINNAYTVPSSTTPAVYFQTEGVLGSKQALVGADGTTAATSSDVANGMIMLCFWDPDSNTLRMLTGL